MKLGRCFAEFGSPNNPTSAHVCKMAKGPAAHQHKFITGQPTEHGSQDETRGDAGCWGPNQSTRSNFQAQLATPRASLTHTSTAPGGLPHSSSGVSHVKGGPRVAQCEATLATEHVPGIHCANHHQGQYYGGVGRG